MKWRLCRRQNSLGSGGCAGAFLFLGVAAAAPAGIGRLRRRALGFDLAAAPGLFVLWGLRRLRRRAIGFDLAAATRLFILLRRFRRLRQRAMIGFDPAALRPGRVGRFGDVVAATAAIVIFCCGDVGVSLFVADRTDDARRISSDKRIRWDVPGDYSAGSHD